MNNIKIVMELKIDPFMTVLDPDTVYEQNDTNLATAKHACWMTNYWDSLINLQLNSINTHGRGLLMAREAATGKYELSWLLKEVIMSSAEETVKNLLCENLMSINPLNTFVIYFADNNKIGMAYKIKIPL